MVCILLMPYCLINLLMCLPSSAMWEPSMWAFPSVFQVFDTSALEVASQSVNGILLFIR